MTMIRFDFQFTDSSYMDTFEDLPHERVQQRKARLYEKIIKLFEEGKSYENSFRFYKDLCDYYEGVRLGVV